MSERQLVNLTSRPISLKPNADDENRLYLPSEGRARLVSRPKRIGNVRAGSVIVPLYEYRDRQLLDLPDPDDGKFYIVSGVVADWVGQERDDIFAVGGKLATTTGRIIAGQWLARWVR